MIGKLRTTRKITTITSVDWEKTGTRFQFRREKKGNLRCSRSVGRQVDDDDTECKVNVKLWCSFATKFFVMASFKTMQDLIFLSRTSNFIDDEEFFVLSDLFECKNSYFPYEIIQLSTWMRWPSPSVCQSLDFEKDTSDVIAVFHGKFISFLLKIYDLPYPNTPNAKMAAGLIFFCLN